jgi:arabinofuranosyltransferase
VHVPPPPVHRGRALALFALSALLLGLHAASFWPFVTDDALISLRYARRLLDGHGLSWTGAERVEGYSNPLWVLGCAALGALGLDLILAARVLGCACTLGAIALCMRCFPPRRGQAAVVGAIVPIGLASAGPLAAWSIGGLEGPLVLLLLAAALRPLLALAAQADARCAWRAGVPLALLCLTRPDGALFTALACGALVLLHGLRSGLPVAARLLGLPVLAVLGLTAFRLAYYGDWVPNTAHAKAEVGAMSLKVGLVGYGLYALVPLCAWVALALLGARAALRAQAGRDAGAADGALRAPLTPARAQVLLLATLAAGWSAYVLAIGGDPFWAWRHHAPNVLFACCLGALGAQHAFARTETAGAARQAPWWIALLVLPWSQIWDSRQIEARRERWVADGLAWGEFLGRAFEHEQPLLAVDAAGCLPYASQLPALDMLGLNDRHIARQPTRPGTRFMPGHMRGDAAYVLARQPDLLVFGIPMGEAQQAFHAGGRFFDLEEFRRAYRLVALGGGGERAQGRSWARLEGRAGLTRTPERVRVPAYFFGSLRAQAQLGPRAAAEALAFLQAASYPGQLAPEGGVLTHAAHTEWAWLRELDLPAGRWCLSARPHGARVEHALAHADKPVPAEADGCFSWAGGALDLGVRAHAVNERLDALVLERAPR